MEQWGRFLVILALGACASPALAQTSSAPSNSVRPARFEEAPVIDGRIDEAVWTKAARLEGFRQIQPGDNLPASQQTEVLIGYDRRALYLAFRAHDTSGTVRAIGAPFMVIATLMAVRAFPTRPAIAGALCGMSAGILSDAGWRLSCWFSDPVHILGSHGLAILGLAAAGSLLAVVADIPRWRNVPRV